MLIRLVYFSKAVDPQTRASTDWILRQAHAWNTQNDELIARGRVIEAPSAPEDGAA